MDHAYIVGRRKPDAQEAVVSQARLEEIRHFVEADPIDFASSTADSPGQNIPTNQSEPMSNGGDRSKTSTADSHIGCAKQCAERILAELSQDEDYLASIAWLRDIES